MLENYNRMHQKNTKSTKKRRENEKNIFLLGCKADKTKMRYDTSGLLQRELSESGRINQGLMKIRVKDPDLMEKELATTR